MTDIIELEDLPRLSEEDKEKITKTLEEMSDQKINLEDNRKGICIVCGGETIARVTEKYFGDIGSMIVGPGSRSQLTTIHHGFHCKNCGLKYEFPLNKEEVEKLRK